MPSFFKFVFLALFFQLGGNLYAQNSQTLHQFDTKIEAFTASEQPDSLLYYLEAKAQLAKQADSLALWAWVQWEKQQYFFNDNRYALQILQQALAQKWREPQNAEEFQAFLWILSSKGWHLLSLGQITQAIQEYELAGSIFEKYPPLDFDAVHSIYKPLGNSYTRLGDNDKAIAVFQKALAIGADNESMSGLYANIGIAYWNQADFIAAEENYRKGLSLSGISDTKRGFLLGRLAETMLDLNRTDEAARRATEAIRLLRPDGSDDTRTLEFRARARRILGLANTQLGKFAEAERLLKGALADDRACAGDTAREVGKDYIALSKLYLKKGQALQALQAADQALASVLPSFKPQYIDKQQNAKLTRHGISEAGSPVKQFHNPPINQFYEENTIFEALTTKAAAAQSLFEKSGDAQWLELALECHELAYQAESILRHVYQYSSSKLSLQKDARVREESAMNVARLLFEKTGQNLWLEKAFAISERSKAALLLEALQDNLVRLKRSGSDPRFNELTVLRQSLSYFDKSLLLEPGSTKVPQWRIEADGIRGKITALEQTLRKEYPSLSGFETNTANLLPTPGDFKEGEALVGYFMSEQWVDVFVFQKDKNSVWQRIPNDVEFQGLIRRYLAFFENDYAILNDPAGYFQTAYTLWQKLLPPETATASILTILPDGILNFVPFEALITSINKTSTLRNAAYLLRQQAVRYAWSLAVLRQQKNLKSQASNYLLSIAPGFKNRERNLSPLASPDFDWGGITGWNVRQLNDQEADLQHFVRAAGAYRVLHFSTHAFATGNPRIELMDSSLLLPDLYALPLQADLVMLSACETGLGKEAKGEGVMSLARAFAQAGAACIVSSLWSVNDQSTARLLRCFYEKMGQGLTTSAALREAKLAYLSDSEVGSVAQSPYFWAGLVAVGDDRVIEQPWGWGLWGILGAGGVILWMVGWWYWRKIKGWWSDDISALPFYSKIEPKV